MQTNNKDKKKKYSMDDFLAPNRANPVIQTYNQEKKSLSCICGSHDFTGLKCFKCCVIVHGCLAKKNNRQNLYECSSCLSKALDPLIQVKKVLIQSHFKTYSIFDYSHIYNFEFVLGPQELSYSIEIRGLIPDNTGLVWPMQGAFYLNDQKGCIHQLKPLLLNSNRKSRRQQFFSIPSDKLKLGKNSIKFKIPCLDRAKFTPLYQHQQKKIYFMSVNLIVKLTPAELQTQTFRQRRLQKIEGIKILQLNNADVQITSNKVCLICPYTKDRIKVPVRGKYCKHFTCICLQTLIVTHASSRGWGCPICQNRMNEPYVDVWFYNMLKDNQKGSEVIIKEDGSYEWLQQRFEAMNLDDDDSSPFPVVPNIPVALITTENPKIPKPEINIDIEDILIEGQKVQKNYESIKSVDKIIKPVIQQKVIQNKANEIDLIDLDDSPQENQINQRQKGTQNRKNMVSKLKNQAKEVLTQGAKQQSAALAKEIEQKDKKRKQLPKSIPPKPKVPIITDIPILQMKEMKFDQLKKMHFKGKANHYKKYIQNEQMKKIFKQII